MRSVTVRLEDLKNMVINIGFAGENEHTRVSIDCKKMFDQYPHAAASMTVQPPAEDAAAYPAVIERDGDLVIWDVTDSDLISEGSGSFQLAFTVGEVVAKSYIGRLRISRSIIPTGEIPEPLDDFLTRAGAALTAIPETIDQALEEAKESGEFDGPPGADGRDGRDGTDGEDGFSPTASVSKSGGVATITITDKNGTTTAEIADGADGRDGRDGSDGAPGADGFSPAAGVSKSGGVATITITDKNGTTTAEISDGADGQDGSDGAPGADGFSPAASVTKSGKTATISITDKNGTTTATVSDGEDADPTQLIDDTAGSGVTDKAWSAGKTDSELGSVKSAINSVADDVDTYLVHSNVLFRQPSFSVGQNGSTYQQKVFYTLEKDFVTGDAYTFECDSIVGNTTQAIRYKVMNGTTQIRTANNGSGQNYVQVEITSEDVTAGADNIIFFVYASTSVAQTQACVLTNPVVYEGLTHSESILYAENFVNKVNDLIDKPTTLLQSGSIHPDVVWENGQIDSTTGLDITGNYNRRTKGYISIEDYNFVASMVKPTSDSLTTYLYEYDATKTFLGKTSRSTTGDLTPQNSSCKYVRVFTYSETVAQSSQESYVTLTIINTESVHGVYENLPLKLDKSEYNGMLHAFDLLDSSVLYRTDEIQIGATKNNDSGNTTYIFKNIVVSEKIGCVWLRVKEISNARLNSVFVYFYNSKTTQTGSTLISSVQLDDGLAKYGAMLICPVGTLSIRVSLYPSVSGGLTTQYATYSGVIVGVTKFRINPMDLIQKEEKPVPFYYFQNDYLKNKIAAIRQAITASGGNYDAFVFCTDQHWKLNAKNSPALIKYISEELNIKRLFMGGDYADGINMDALKAYKEPSDYSVYNTIGNHEYGNFFEEDGVQIAQTIDENDIWLYLDGGMTDAVIGNSGRGYYYVDNPMQKMRYIILSVYAESGGSATYTFETAQKEWLRDTALNLPTGYTAVIFAHFLCGFDYDTGAVNVALNSDLEGVVDAYNGSGEIACMLAGHTHIDGTTTTTGGIPIFVTTCDKYYPWIQNGTDMEPWLTANRHLGTITEQAFDVVVIDKTNKKVSLVRIGAPADNGANPKLEVRTQNYGT